MERKRGTLKAGNVGTVPFTEGEVTEVRVSLSFFTGWCFFLLLREGGSTSPYASLPCIMPSEGLGEADTARLILTPRVEGCV